MNASHPNTHKATHARPTHPGRLGFWLVLLVAATGCPSVKDPYTPLPVPSFSDFVTQVQPVLSRHCASAGCHGTVGGSLTVYAVDYLRAPPAFADTPLDEKHLTDAELAWNFDALRMRMRGEKSAQQSKLLLKTLDPKLGGIRHGDGIRVFRDRNHPDFNILRDWIAGGLQ